MERLNPDIIPHNGDRNVSVGHLSIHVEGAHPADVPFSFEEQQKRLGPAFLVALMYHVGMLILIVFAIRYGTYPTSVPTAVQPERMDARIIWLNEPGPGGGGGGGGNRMPEPLRPAELPGKDTLTVPASKPPTLEPPKQAKEPDPVEQLNIPAKPLAAATESLPGAIETPAPPSPSQGAGTGGGAGTGTGSGIGPGTGSGLGPGSGGGTGGGAYRPGNGVTMPRLLREVKPEYTSDAMRAKIQGVVLLECVVNTNGNVEQIKIIRSLDQTFGLDEQAIKAAKQWRFAPGTRLGEAVPVLVSIELGFTLR